MNNNGKNNDWVKIQIFASSDFNPLSTSFSPSAIQTTLFALVCSNQYKFQSYIPSAPGYSNKGTIKYKIKKYQPFRE